jgi:hypothetical protein
MPPQRSIPAGLQLEATDLATTNADEQEVATEAQRNPDGGNSQVCADAGTAGADAETVGADAGTVSVDAVGVEADLGTLRYDPAALQSDFVQL